MARPCPYCDRLMKGRRHAPTRDHINPKSRGGGPTVICCAVCNVFKADRSVVEWLSWIAANRPHRLRAIIRLYEHHHITSYITYDERMALTRMLKTLETAKTAAPISHGGTVLP